MHFFIYVFLMILNKLKHLLNKNELIFNLVKRVKMTNSETIQDRMLLTLTAPSVHNSYYRPAFDKIVDFQVNFANSIINNDNVVIVVDDDTYKYYKNRVPEDIILIDEIDDIWMRDFTTVNPLNPVQFKYTPASMSEKLSKKVQNSFDKFAKKYHLEFLKANYLLDGGNIVDSYDGKVF